MLYGDQTFRGRIYKIKLAEISRIYLNKHFGVKIISIGQFVVKIIAKSMQFEEAFRWRQKRQNYAYFMTSRKWRINYDTQTKNRNVFSEDLTFRWCKFFAPNPLI